MKPLKFAMTALILASAGAAGAQSVSTDTGVSTETEGSLSAETGTLGGEPSGVDADAGMTAEGGADAGIAEEGTATASGDSLMVPTEAGATTEAEGSIRLSEGSEVVGTDGATIGSISEVVDEAEGLVRIELDETLQTQIPAVVLSAQTLTAVEGEATVPMTGAEFAAAVEQLSQGNATATN